MPIHGAFGPQLSLAYFLMDDYFHLLNIATRQINQCAFITTIFQNKALDFERVSYVFHIRQPRRFKALKLCHTL